MLPILQRAKNLNTQKVGDKDAKVRDRVSNPFLIVKKKHSEKSGVQYYRYLRE